MGPAASPAGAGATDRRRATRARATALRECPAADGARHPKKAGAFFASETKECRVDSSPRRRPGFRFDRCVRPSACRRAGMTRGWRARPPRARTAIWRCATRSASAAPRRGDHRESASMDAGAGPTASPLHGARAQSLLGGRSDLSGYRRRLAVPRRRDRSVSRRVVGGRAGPRGRALSPPPPCTRRSDIRRRQPSKPPA